MPAKTASNGEQFTNPFEEDDPDVVVATSPVSIQEYSATTAALADLRNRYAAVVYPVTTSEGMDAAKKARGVLKGYRTGLERMRVEIKAPALKRCQLIDSEAKAISAEISALEDPIDRQIRTEENRILRERIARDEAERDRVAAIMAKIEELRRLPLTMVGKGAEAIRSLINQLTQTVFAREDAKSWSDKFEEFANQACAARDAAIVTLTALEQQERTEEAEAARVAADRAELEQLRAEAQAAREAVAKAEAEAQEAERRARREACQAEEAAYYVEQQRLRLEERRQAEEQEAARQAEQQRVDAELAALRSDPTMAAFIEQAVKYRTAATPKAATETLIALCGLYQTAIGAGTKAKGRVRS